ncbi:MAG: hypothetical protein CL804_03505 [Citromicrobium sp.]|nr:hypothetical protein [Citromicrobium sp.]|tara:strand:- start:7745 stop:7927 length:183 start_codon:yes stop_codon:yes gene_type:complete
MPSSDPAFTAWLREAEIAKGYPRDWIRRNLPALRAQYDREATLPPCPPREVGSRDRYEEL